jgi:hypothetical protein
MLKLMIKYLQLWIFAISFKKAFQGYFPEI